MIFRNGPAYARVSLLTLAVVTTAVACESGAAPKQNAQAAASASASAAAAAPPKPTDIPAPPDVAEPPADAQRTPSGLASKVLQPGTGDKHPAPRDKVKVHYTGWTKDGKMFDSSVVRGEASEFGLNQVIAGWTEGLQLMVPGEKRRFWIPATLAYGERPRPGAPMGQLTFDVELLDFTVVPPPPPPQPPPPVPEDVAAAPKTAQKTASGLQSRVLKPGTGKEHPSALDKVTVHYSGWTPDGKMFDSSIVRGKPITFQLDQVIKGWSEGVQLMVAGEKRRFWIPSNLAYGDKPARPGAPAGPLTFDVELLEITKATPGAHP